MALFNLKTTLITLVAAFVAVIIWILIVERDERLTDARLRTDTKQHITTLSTSLELALEKRLAVFSGIKGFVDHNLKHFGDKLDDEMKSRLDEFVQPQYDNIFGIRNFSVAPNGVQEWVFPLEGNTSALGHDLFNNPFPDVPESIQRALKTKEKTISGPYDLRQGGLGLIVRQVIYLENKVWGLVAMVIDIPPVLKVSNISLERNEYIVGLRTNNHFQFWGNDGAFSEQAEVAKIILPDGYWELGVLPQKGFTELVEKETRFFKVYLAAFLLLIVSFIFFFVNRQRVLEEEVRKKTLEFQISEKRFRNFAESASDWFWEADVNNVFTYCSKRYFEITGFDPKDLPSFDYKTLLRSNFDDQESEKWQALYQQVDNREPIKHFEYQTIRENKDIIYISVSGTPIFDEEGVFRGYRGTGIDITERKLAELENKTYAELFNKWKNSNFIGVVQCDASGKILDINDTLLSIIGYSRDEFEKAGLDWSTLTPEKYHHLDQIAMGEAAEKGFWTAFEKEYYHKDGHSVPILIGGSQYKRRPNHYIEFVLDLTEQKKNESVLADAKKNAEAATLAKSEFLAAMSHEIRTPMAGVVGMAELLVDSGLSSQQLDWAMNVRSSGLTLLKILNEILDQSKLEAGKLEIAPIDFDLPSFIHEITNLFGPNITSKGLKLVVELDEKLPKVVKADRMRIGQVLSNLLSNALKFTEDGEITVRVSHEMKGMNDLVLHFSVADSGIGMTKKERDRLFLAFSQADSSTSRNYGGTGLGLSISQKLTKLMGGEIGVFSNKGSGSTFWFDVQCKMSSESIPKSPRKPLRDQWKASRQLKILLAEDNAINQQLIQMIFYNLGHDVTIVNDGEAAVEQVKKHDFDVILMDVRMPVMDGLEATKVIRDLGGVKADVPIVAVTADIASGNLRKYTDAGMNDVCSKPIEVFTLLQAINRQFKGLIHTQMSDEVVPELKIDILSPNATTLPKSERYNHS